MASGIKSSGRAFLSGGRTAGTSSKHSRWKSHAERTTRNRMCGNGWADLLGRDERFIQQETMT